MLFLKAVSYTMRNYLVKFIALCALHWTPSSAAEEGGSAPRDLRTLSPQEVAELIAPGIWVVDPDNDGYGINGSSALDACRL